MDKSGKKVYGNINVLEECADHGARELKEMGISMEIYWLLGYFQQLIAQMNAFLPSTGEGNNLIMIIVGVLIVLAAIALFVSGRKKK